MVITTKFTVEKPKEDPYVVNITENVNKEIAKSGVKEGSVLVFVPGSTASVSTIEYEPNLLGDLSEMLERITPSDVEYRHSKTWGENNGKSHLRASLFSASIIVPVSNGKMMLGEWQQLVIMDFDTRPRKRDVVVQVLG
jgi:secondary thiamine-phosphate synthase enzyme